MKFIPRTEAPKRDNKYYINVNYGGYNKDISIDNGFVLPNCTGYSNGRFMECQELTSSNLYTGDAKDFFGYTKDGYKRGQTPKLGAIACWKGGQYGHVGSVEFIEGSKITCSMSAWHGAEFYTRTLEPPYNYTGSEGYMEFQGFIYPDVEFKDDEPQPEIKVGDKVVVSGRATEDSYGNGKQTAEYGGNPNDPTDIRYVTAINPNAPRPYHISVGDKLGDGDRGWVARDQIRKVD